MSESARSWTSTNNEAEPERIAGEQDADADRGEAFSEESVRTEHPYIVTLQQWLDLSG
jgi:hypothetical protein